MYLQYYRARNQGVVGSEILCRVGKEPTTIPAGRRVTLRAIVAASPWQVALDRMTAGVFWITTYSLSPTPTTHESRRSSGDIPGARRPSRFSITHRCLCHLVQGHFRQAQMTRIMEASRLGQSTQHKWELVTRHPGSSSPRQPQAIALLQGYITEDLLILEALRVYGLVPEVYAKQTLACLERRRILSRATCGLSQTSWL
jgi:hypothetical protein